MSPASSPRRLLSDLIARLFGRHRGERPDPDPPHSSASRRAGARDGTGAGAQDDGEEVVAIVSVRVPAASHKLDKSDGSDELTTALTLKRVETMLTGPMGYGVRWHEEQGHPCLLGTWDTFPFVIEEPEGHKGWLLISGDWEEPIRSSQRDEIAASVNDWNRDKFFPTVALVESPLGPVVRATYLTDLSSGVTDTQLRLHLDTALSSCTQALSRVGPLLPEM